MKPRGGLGRGLEALIPAGGPALRTVPIDAIAPNPHQPRQAHDPEALAELAASIKEHGVLQPLIVTEGRAIVSPATTQPSVLSPQSYVLIAGERRWRAARLAGLATVPVVVKEATPQAQLELALVENLQRADLNPLEAAAAYQQLVEEFGLSQEQVASRVGKNRATVANTLRLLRLVDAARQALLDGAIAEGHARALLGLNDPDLQRQALAAVLQQGLTVRQTEALVRRWLENEPSAASRQPPAASNQDAEILDLFRQALGTRVELSRGPRGGRLVIHFFSDEELAGLYDRLAGR